VDETYHELFELSCYGISRGYIRAAGKQLSEHLKWRIDSNPAEKDLLMPSLTSLKRYLRQEEGFVERFICQNLRLVAKQANHFHHQLHFRLSGMDESDLIQQGNLGLMKAVDKWDYRMGYRFATYASWWIRQSIDRGVANQSKTIRFPVHMLETQRQYRHGYFTLLNELGREPRPEEVADQINMPRDKLDKITLAPQKKFSLSQPMRNDEDSQEFGNTLIDEQSPDPEELCIESNLSEIFSRLFFSHLSAREEKIICMRYGIREKRSFTLQEIGDTLELTRERIRQVEGTAMKKLRGSAVKKKLRGRPIDSRTFL